MTSSKGEGVTCLLSCAGVMLQYVSHSDALRQHTSQAQTCQGVRAVTCLRRGLVDADWHTEVRWTWEGGPGPV